MNNLRLGFFKNEMLRTNLASYLVFLAFIDLLFIPRLLSPVAMPLSLFFMMILPLFFRYDVKNLILATVFIICIFGSLLNSSLLGGDNVTDDIKRALQLISFFSYLIIANRAEYNVKYYIWVLRIFFVWIFILSLFFLSNPSQIINIMSTYYPESIFIQENNLINLRFSYIFQDPNAAGYLYAILFACYMVIEKNWKFQYIILLFSLFAITLTQSRGALLAFFTIITVFLIFDRKYLPKYYYFIFVIMFPLLVLYLAQSEDIITVLDMLSSRGEQEESLGGGRLGKYIYMLNNFNFMPFGVGYNLTKNGEIFRPHSDLIRLILSYGLVVLLIFFYTITPKIKEQIYILIPFMFGFLINSILDGYRLTCIFFILTCLIYKTYRNHRKVS